MTRVVIGGRPVRHNHAATGPHLGEPPLPLTAAQLDPAPPGPGPCPTCGRTRPNPVNTFATGGPNAGPIRLADDPPDAEHSPELADDAGEPTPGDVLRERYGYAHGVPSGIPNPSAAVRTEGEEFEDVTLPAGAQPERPRPVNRVTVQLNDGPDPRTRRTSGAHPHARARCRRI